MSNRQLTFNRDRELFGPILPILPVNSIEDAISRIRSGCVLYFSARSSMHSDFEVGLTL